ncbi:MAG: damage-inducible protein DinB [Candidatus Acidiferrum sp.]
MHDELAVLLCIAGGITVSPEQMRALYEYNAWANHRSLGGAEGLSAEQFVKPLGSSFSSVRDTLVHIYSAEWIWLERFEGRVSKLQITAEQFTEIGLLREEWREREEQLLAFTNGLTQQNLDGIHEYTTLSYGPGRNPLWQSMQHLVNHGTYHRGQVASMLRQLGAVPKSTDLIAFYRERGAAAGA